MKLYGIWCKDVNDNKGDWLRELESVVNYGGTAILAFERKRDACDRAAEHYSFDSYTEAKRKDWCEVRQLL